MIEGSFSKSQPLAPGTDVLAVPRFYVTPRQRLTASSLVLAFLAALALLVAVSWALNQRRVRHLLSHNSSDASSGRAGAGSGATDDGKDDDDDPSRVDTVYLGGPSEAPVATRPGGRASAVHPFVVVHLPRAGDQTGQIPDTPAGHLLYNWLAAFNGTDPSAFRRALPSAEVGWAEAAQVELRKETGGFTLVSAKEVRPGVIVFRLHDQTVAATEVLGTLEVRPGSTPASVASFSLRAVPSATVRPQ